MLLAGEERQPRRKVNCFQISVANTNRIFCGVDSLPTMTVCVPFADRKHAKSCLTYAVIARGLSEDPMKTKVAFQAAHSRG